MPAVTGFFHAGVTVRDMEASLGFYRDGLGLDVHLDRVLDADYLRTVLALDFESIRAVYLTIPGGGFVELLEYRGIERLSAASRPNDFGAGHLCLYVEGIDELVERLRAVGGSARSAGVVDITSGPNEGARSIYMRDPDGYPVELFERKA
ncbi:VOC family protein [Salinibacterium soli]|uniref:VOC family protein n=1 Tax=Antiquaquibacter soli TaxID=3064523 RepID=A0ABT9BKL5_9MICO|nr:VOC family protein [Protaetiibacter sp. WY-16]MDO7881563.1 VOC family protein [Protaetiibacter sp. WY-16]